MNWLTSIWVVILSLLLLLFSIQLQSQFIHCLPDQIEIGILLHENQYEQESIFKWSVDQVNHRSILNKTILKGIIKKIALDDSWDAERKVCELLEEGSIAIIGPSNDAQTSHHVESICDALDVPHFNIATRGVVFNSQATGTNLIVGSAYPRVSPLAYQSSISADLSISRTILIQACIQVLRKLKWKNFVYLYEQNESLYHLQEYFDGKGLKADGMNIKIRRFDPKKPFRDEFWTLKGKNIKHIMLDVRCSNLKTVLKHAQQVSMMTEIHCYLIVCLDTQTIDLQDFQHSRSRIVWLTVSDPSSSAIETLTANLNEGKDIEMFSLANGFRLSPEHLETESALVHDSVETFAYTLRVADSSQNLNSLARASCKNSRSFPRGSSLVNDMRSSVELEGMSGLVRFNPTTGQRSDFVLNIMRLTEAGPEKIGNWTHGYSNLVIDKKVLDYLQREPLSSGDEREHLIVTSIKNEPYLMNKQTSKPETGNSRYEGYSIDLMEELSRLVGFDYTFKEVDDGKYGKYDAVEKKWNGMIREVQIGAADLAIADLSITSDRETAVDFTLPYMNTGVSILFKKPTTNVMELFTFLSPFEQSVWVYVCGAYIGVSFLLFVVGRISPYEWADPHPCRQEDKILRNQFSLANSFWFTIAAVMQQGSDLAPKSLSTRLVAAIWYFFTLIMISSYTANLAAFLTVEKVIYPIERAEDLYKHPAKIEYGCLGNGSTHGFFNGSKPDSTLRKMLADMKFVDTNDIGKKNVEAGNYAYFMESASIEYTIERSCNLTQIGGLLDSKGYGIAIAKNSNRTRDYRTLLSEAILSLQESGVLEILKTRWWKEKRGGGACDIDDSQGGEGVKELTMKNVGGVFVVLLMGIAISFILCALELFLNSCKLAKVKGTTKWAQAKRRISFALSLSENY